MTQKIQLKVVFSLLLAVAVLFAVFAVTTPMALANEGEVVVRFSDDEALNQAAWENLEREFGAVKIELKKGFVWLPHKSAAWEILELPGVVSVE